MQTFPKLKSVTPLAGKKLRVTFSNGAVRIYDCNSLLEEEPFRLLRDEAFFRSVHVEPGGYAVVWDDRTDLAESELWLHGKPLDTGLQRGVPGEVAEA
jgi:hypothetical protein